MIIKTLNREEAQKGMDEWIRNYPALPVTDGDYIKIREDIQKYEKQIRQEAETKDKRDYYIDVHLGMALYTYLWKQPGFTMRAASNDDFWRYLSIKVVPDVVAGRWGYENESHYWSKPARIWLRCIWWYIHLSWQGDAETTLQVLDSSCFTTDSILNLEERTGRKGTYIGVYRYIMYFYSRVPQSEIEKFGKRDGKEKKDDLFRVIMKLHTAKSLVTEPALYLGGEREYVRSLFRDAGVNV